MRDDQASNVERRQSARHILALGISIRQPRGRPLPTQLSNFSAGGCAIGHVNLNESEELWVRLPGLESQLATAIRRDESGVAVEFHRPLYPAVADALVDTHRFADRIKAWTERRPGHLAEQRSEPRYVCTRPADVDLAGSPAVLRNVSLGGVEAETSTTLRRGSVVPIKVGKGPVIAARVVRRQGNRVGLRLPRFSLILNETSLQN